MHITKKVHIVRNRTYIAKIVQIMHILQNRAYSAKSADPVGVVRCVRASSDTDFWNWLPSTSPYPVRPDSSLHSAAPSPPCRTRALRHLPPFTFPFPPLSNPGPGSSCFDHFSMPFWIDFRSILLGSNLAPETTQIDKKKTMRLIKLHFFDLESDFGVNLTSFGIQKSINI